MSIIEKKTRVEKWVNEILEGDEEFFVVDIKFPGVNKLQVFIDGDNGITISRCTRISRSLEKLLEESNMLGEKYVLEVSSPGIDNPLMVLRQYKRRVGSEVNVVKTDGQRIDGKLIQVDEDKIFIDQQIKVKNKVIETEIFEVPFTDIKRTKLNFNF